MKPKDCISQIIDSHTGWDQQDTMAFTLYEPTCRGIKYAAADIDFEKGLVSFWNDKDTKAEEFSIKVSIEPVTD